MKKVEFGYHLPVTQEINYIMKCALKASEIGFDIISHQDHLLVVSDERGCRPECWTFLTAVAMKTNVKVMPLVLCSLFRNPTLLAKIVTTLDQLSKGRVYVGIGACWWREEFEAYGFPWEEPKVRVDKTLEVIKILKMLWTQDTVNYEGKFWRIVNCRLVPRPYQKPHPPIISGGGRPRMLRITGKYCDGWIPQIRDLDEYKSKMKYITKYLKKPSEEFIWGNVIDIRKGDKVEDIITLIEDFIKIGVKCFILFMHPQRENYELLDKYGRLIIEHFKQ